MVTKSSRPFLYSSSVYSCHLFLISSASVRSLLSVLYCVHLYMKCSLGISNFLKEISSLSHSIVFFCISILFSQDGFLVSPCFSLELCIQLHISFSFSFAFLYSSQLLVSPPQTAILPFCISFSWGWSLSLPPVQCHKPPSIVLPALSLSHLIPWIYFSLPLYNSKGFYLDHTWMV